MTDTSYLIHTESSTLYAEYVTSDPASVNNRTRGSTATFDVRLNELGNLTVPGGETYTIPSGTSEAFFDVDLDGTLVVDGTLIITGTFDHDGVLDQNGTVIQQSGAADQLGELLGLDRHAGSYTLQDSLNNTQRYREQTPDTAPSLVVGVKPNSDLESRNLTGKWGLVSNITDGRTRPLTRPVVSLEIDILGDYAEYSSVTDVQQSLEI